MSPTEDDRSAQARAYSRATQVMTICLEMVVPGLIGFWVDQKLGTRVVFTVLGFGVGLSGGLRHLIKMSDSRSGESRSGRDGGDESANQNGNGSRGE